MDSTINTTMRKGDQDQPWRLVDIGQQSRRTPTHDLSDTDEYERIFDDKADVASLE